MAKRKRDCRMTTEGNLTIPTFPVWSFAAIIVGSRFVVFYATPTTDSVISNFVYAFAFCCEYDLCIWFPLDTSKCSIILYAQLSDD